MTTEHERFMRIALEEAASGGAEGNIAVGSVVVRDASVLGRGHNTVNSKRDPTAHAETEALRHAGEASGKVDFTGCTLYTTFEPCPMCCGAIMASGVSALVMGARHDPTDGRWGTYTVEALIQMAGREDVLRVFPGVLTQECHDIRDQWEK